MRIDIKSDANILSKVPFVYITIVIVSYCHSFCFLRLIISNEKRINIFLNECDFKLKLQTILRDTTLGSLGSHELLSYLKSSKHEMILRANQS